MAVDWTTFILEIINFLALIWILKRFLYGPILTVLAERRSGIARTLSEAKDMEGRAAALKQQFESRLADWENEKAAARKRFESDLAAERARQMDALAGDLALERARSAAIEAHRMESAKQELAAHASAQARRFASELLASLAGPELDGRLGELFCRELENLPDDRLAVIRIGQNGDGTGAIHSAYPLPEATRQRISAVVETRLGKPVRLEFAEDASLLAGVRLTLGAWQLDMSLAGELGAFEEAEQIATPNDQTAD